MGKRKHQKEILIMKPFMPPLQEFQPYLDRIWASRRLTNNGPIHTELEKALCDFLGVKYISLFSSGTMALTIALKSLKLKGEVITTPYTSPATVQAIHWNNLKPVFADINGSDLNIDVSEIERNITVDTCAILPVHIFGNPCHTDQIKALAEKYSLKVVYDAAHCFGVKIKGESICNFGDLSILSFHATKVFNSFEGGAVICHDEKTKRYLDVLKNTGLTPEHKIAGYGLNAKLNEIQAAFGLIQLNHVDEVIRKRKKASARYKELLKDLKGVELIPENRLVTYNHSYFPLMINSGEFGVSCEEVMAFLQANNIYARRYFYPLLTGYPEFSNFKANELPVAERLSANILCLPLYHDITNGEITMIAGLLHQFQQATTV